ncbi:MAG: haloacid dehalogenase-like hydrolase [Treponemataceae bacterium]|nr:haloacid dehalogenase-like hydrolase [Treponemataceae bacterium]
MSKPKVALIYDFDGTLSPRNMQEFSFIEALGMNAQEFWSKAEKLSKEQDASGILCYMQLMLKEARHSQIPVKRESFENFGKKIEFFPGVLEWFDLVNEYGRKIGLDIRHYINSSGLKEMIEGTAIAKKFEKIYACSFLYDENGVAEWPAVAVDYTTKTQFIFKINKGIEEVNDNKKINEYVAQEERPVPFKRMIYFGDGETDIPCMKLVKQSGGHSIAVFRKGDAEKQKRAEKLILDDRVNFVCPADYRQGHEIFEVIKTVLDKIKSDYDFDVLLKKHQTSALKFKDEK